MRKTQEHSDQKPMTTNHKGAEEESIKEIIYQNYIRNRRACCNQKLLKLSTDLPSTQGKEANRSGHLVLIV